MGDAYFMNWICMILNELNMHDIEWIEYAWYWINLICMMWNELNDSWLTCCLGALVAARSWLRLLCCTLRIIGSWAIKPIQIQSSCVRVYKQPICLLTVRFSFHSTAKPLSIDKGTLTCRPLLLANEWRNNTNPWWMSTRRSEFSCKPVKYTCA